MGIDQIRAKFIKIGIHVVTPVLTVIVIYAIKYNIFPCRWKLAVIKLLPKMPNPVGRMDFRPISLFVAISKILEKVMAIQWQKYLFMGTFLWVKILGSLS